MMVTMSGVRIIHVSDLHLFVTSEGLPRPTSHRARSAVLFQGIAQGLGWVAGKVDQELAKKVERTIEGLSVHSQTMLEAMNATLREIAASSPASVLLQTGDVATFGGDLQGAEVTFPEWAYWRGGACPRLALPHVRDLFGNHDVWPATFPLLAPTRIPVVVRALRDQYFPRRMPERVRLTDAASPWALDLYLLNTVVPEARRNTWATGELRSDQHDETGPAEYACGSDDPLHQVAHLAREASAPTRQVRVLAMHHPPHYFAKADAGVTSDGELHDSQRLAQWLDERRAEGLPFHCVIAGHRHAVDPPDPHVQAVAQPPLGPGTLQLVCGSPTQWVKPQAPKTPSAGLRELAPEPVKPEPVKPSFSVYDFALTATGVEITRRVWQQMSYLDDRFSEGAATTFTVR